MITEDYVSFETAKLLKEKGFEGRMHTFYTEEGTDIESSYVVPSNFFPIYRPTLQMAMKWLREEYDLHIIAYPWRANKEERAIHWCCRVYKSFNLFGYERYTNETPKSYEEACEAAIKYCLNNLIENEDKEEESGIPVPKTVNEAISTLEKILSDEDREYLLKNGAISMHHSLGRWIRNEWGLWTDSELKNELKKKGFEHPDDMSNYIIEEFIKCLEK